MMKIRAFRLTLLLVLTLFPGTLLSAAVRAGDGELEIEFLDVGQGDAALIRTPGGFSYLIDAGPSSTGLLRLLLDRGIDKLEGILVSHPHSDHIGGAPLVIRRLDLKTLYDPGYRHTSGVYRDLLMAAYDNDLDYIMPARGDTLAWDPALDILVLHPDTNTYSNINNNSIVLRITYDSVSVLFTGDAERRAENSILEAMEEGILPPGALNADILKVGHHGSRSSSSPAFLDAVSPHAAVISAGEGNPYGHPHPETLDALFERGIIVHRTDREGTIRFTTDGETWTIMGEGRGEAGAK